ncbi:MAG: recombinase family protein [Prevotellaceae bacterium]|jgi:DNA invertase Pin-like site-specific DNA recombinase|nr:recombinase family protein [Prevotellaceae bacterium]
MIYGYIRVSTDKQDCDNQKIGIGDLAAKMGNTVEKWISDDGISGTVSYQKRKLGKLMKMLKKGDVIYASEISRLARNLFMLFEILKFFTERQIEMYTVKDNYKLDGSITSTVMAFAFGMAAQIERDMISKRTVEGLAARRKAGVVLGRPIGSKSKTRKLDDREEKIIDFLKKGLSYSAIARLLNAHRLTVAHICKERGWSKYKAYYPAEKLDSLTEKMNISVKNNPKHNGYQIKNMEIENNVIFDLYGKNYFSLTEVAKELGISQTSLRSLLKNRGLLDKIKELQQEQREKVKSSCQIAREMEITKQ